SPLTRRPASGRVLAASLWARPPPRHTSFGGGRRRRRRFAYHNDQLRMTDVKHRCHLLKETSPQVKKVCRRLPLPRVAGRSEGVLREVHEVESGLGEDAALGGQTG